MTPTPPTPLLQDAVSLLASHRCQDAPYEPEARVTLLSELRNRLDEWGPSLAPQRARVDAAVRELVEAVLQEVVGPDLVPFEVG